MTDFIYYASDPMLQGIVFALLIFVMEDLIAMSKIEANSTVQIVLNLLKSLQHKD